MTWLTKIFSKFRSDRHLTNSNSEKSFDEMYNDLGAFRYYDQGFILSYGDFLKNINWADIIQINVYKVDQFTIDRVDMEIVCQDRSFSISEELPGWYQFVNKTKEIFPTIPKDWDSNITQPAFATNYTTIYNKASTDQQ